MLKSVSKNLALGIVIFASAALPALADTADWNKQVARIIAAKQVYPHTAQMRGEEGTAKVKIFVGADGTVQKSELVAPSGSQILDKEALALPGKAGNLPAPPGGATTVTLPLTWKLI